MADIYDRIGKHLYRLVVHNGCRAQRLAGGVCAVPTVFPDPVHLCA